LSPLPYGRAIFLAAALLAGPALADDAAPVAPDNRIDLVFEIGAGAGVQPAYEGSDTYIVSPQPIVSLGLIDIPGVVSFGGGPASGFAVKPSFKIRGERSEDDDARLEGLPEIDAAYEVGAEVSYRLDGLRPYLALRRGFGGHEGFVGAVGLEGIVEPAERVTLSAGPRATFADDEYMDTYFGISPEAAAASAVGLAPFDPDAGLKSVGIGAELRYEFAKDWFLNMDAAYDHLVGDAARSPIVEEAGQFSAGAGLSRRFSLDLY